MQRLATAGALALVLSGCVAGGTSYKEFEARQSQLKWQETQRIAAATETIKAGALPADYKPKSDALLASILKDPDSRKVQWVGTSGSVACGTVNAKNSYGGYTGAKVFATLFDPSGSVLSIEIFPSDPEEMRFFKEREKAMAMACGLKPPLTAY